MKLSHLRYYDINLDTLLYDTTYFKSKNVKQNSKTTPFPYPNKTQKVEYQSQSFRLYYVNKYIIHIMPPAIEYIPEVPTPEVLQGSRGHLGPLNVTVH